jgi:hypothetical protein
VNIISKAQELHFAQGVLHGDLQRLDYYLGDMDTPTPKIKEDIEFQRAIIVKLLSWKFFLGLRIELYSSIWTLKTNNSKHQ